VGETKNYINNFLKILKSLHHKAYNYFRNAELNLSTLKLCISENFYSMFLLLTAIFNALLNQEILKCTPLLYQKKKSI